LNIIATADLHIRANRPQFRTDDYFTTVIRKFRQIISTANRYDAILIVAGDFFDSVKVGHKVVNSVLQSLKRLKNKCYVCSGQHDMVFHSSDLTGSPLQTLIHTGKVVLLKNDKPEIVGKHRLYGCSFGEEPKNTEKDSILVIHKSITPEEPPFFLTDAISARDALKKYSSYKLIISGDFHEPFIKRINNRTLINCGPMLRQSIDQTELEPVIWLIKEGKIRKIKLKIEPPEKVFALEQIKKKEDSRFSKELEELVDTLKDKKEKPDYKNTVELIMKESNTSKQTKDKVYEIFGAIDD